MDLVQEGGLVTVLGKLRQQGLHPVTMLTLGGGELSRRAARWSACIGSLSHCHDGRAQGAELQVLRRQGQCEDKNGEYGFHGEPV